MLDTSHGPVSGLYQKLLGECWSELDRTVQRLHASTMPVHAAGVFRVSAGSTWLARILARLMGLPRPAEAVDVRLVVTAQGDAEEWRRTFARQPLVSLQASRSDGLLLERMGRVETRFRLKVVDGALIYESVSAAFCLGRLRLRLPRWLSPRVTASERLAGEEEQLEVSVEVRLPLLGRLIAYEGRLTLIESRVEISSEAKKC
jgi:hypothetical protein